MTLPRTFDLREMQKVIGQLSDEIADLRAEVNGIEVPEVPSNWEDRPVDDAGYTDLVVSPSGVKLVGVNVPSWVTWLTDFDALSFAQSDAVQFQGMQLPHGYMQGTHIHPHVHCAPTAAIADGETIVWTIKYTFASIWGVFPASATTTATFTNDAEQRAKMPAASLSGTSIVANTHLLAGGADVSGEGITLSAVMSGELTLSASSTFASNVLMVSADAHFRQNRLGSRAEYTG